MKRAQADKADEGPAEERWQFDGSPVSGLRNEEPEPKCPRSRSRVEMRMPYTRDEAQQRWIAYLQGGGKFPTNEKELLERRLRISGLRPGEYRGKYDTIQMSAAYEKFPEEVLNKALEEMAEVEAEEAEGAGKREFEEPSERVEIADTAEESQIQVPVDTIEAADEPFEESQLM